MTWRVRRHRREDAPVQPRRPAPDGPRARESPDRRAPGFAERGCRPAGRRSEHREVRIDHAGVGQDLPGRARRAGLNPAGRHRTPGRPARMRSLNGQWTPYGARRQRKVREEDASPAPPLEVPDEAAPHPLSATDDDRRCFNENVRKPAEFSTATKTCSAAQRIYSFLLGSPLGSPYLTDAPRAPCSSVNRKRCSLEKATVSNCYRETGFRVCDFGPVFF